jgi:hypothetical protein
MNRIEQLAPSSIEPEAYMEESYAIVRESFQEFLEVKDLQLSNHSIDYLEGVLDKINFSLSISDNDSHKEDLVNLKQEVWNMVRNQFLKDYEGFVNPDMISVSNTCDLRFIYHFFYYNKRTNLLDFVVNNTFKERKTLSTRFKKNAKKDFMINRLKSELTDILSVNLPIIAFYNEIADDYFSNDKNFSNEINHLVLNFEQIDFLNRIFEDKNPEYVFEEYAKGLLEHNDYPHFITDFRDSIINKLRGVN